MTKQIVPNAQVCHLWAHQSQDYARSNNGNMHFQGRDLYSYNTVIATIYKAEGAGGDVALVSNVHHSSTTGKQTNLVFRALGYGSVMPEFTVPHIGRPGGYAAHDEQHFYYHPEEMHKANAEYYRELFHDCLAKYKRARDHKEWKTSQARDAAENFEKYVRLFAVDAELFDAETLISNAVADRIKAEEKKNTPEYRAKLEKEQAQRRAKEVRDYREVRGKFGPDYSEPYHRGEALFFADDRFARAEKLKAIFADKIAAWLDGTNVQLPRMESALLRLQGKEIQTSWGASFPAEHGKKAFPVIACCRKNQREWNTNGHQIHLGHFAINKITAEGNVVAGCHLVEWPAIERIAIKLGLI